MTDETREAIGTVWHTTEKGNDIVSMHDAQYRAHIARIATLESQVKLLREECKKGRLAFENTDKETYDPETKIEYYAARAATDAAGAIGSE